MYVDRGNMVEYPFDGEFFVKEVDTSLPPSEWEENERIVLSTKCDMQESAKSKSAASGFISASFNIYFPFNKAEGINITKGMFFRGSMYNMQVEGEVIGVFPTQLGGCAVYIKDLESK